MSDEIRDFTISETEEITEPVRTYANGTGIIGSAWYGAWGGMVLFAGMFVLCLSLYDNYSFMDVQSGKVFELILNNYLVHVALFQTQILGAYLVVGAALGAFFGLVGGGFFNKENRKSRLYCIGSGFLGALTFQIAVLLYALGNTPAVYSKYFHEAGPPWSGLQGVATALLIPPVMKVIIALLIFTGCWKIARRISRRLGPLALIALIVAAVVVVSMKLHNFQIPRRIQDQKHPNVLILAADSVRPDRLGCYGHFRQTSPNIDKLAGGSFVFDQAMAVIPRTFPSWASILTGQYPHTHGIRHMFPLPKDTSLDDSIAHLFAQKGYITSVFSDFAGDVFPRMEAGFEITDAPMFDFVTMMDTTALEMHFLLLPYLDNHFGRMVFPVLDAFSTNADPKIVTDRFLRFLDSTPDRPFFTVLFYSTPHFPFGTHFPYYNKFTNENYKGPYKYMKRTSLSEDELTKEDQLQVLGLYDGAIAAFDNEAGRIFRALEDREILENTIIIVTSDHGTSLYENPGDIGHGDHFRGNFTLKIPLIIRWVKDFGKIGKSIPAGRFGGLVSHVDIAPTLVSNFEMNPSGKIEGSDLTRVITQQTRNAHEFLFAESGMWFVQVANQYLKDRRIPYPNIETAGEIMPGSNLIVLQTKYTDIVNIAKHRMVTDGHMKVIAMPTVRGMHYECYNLDNDPMEKEDLSHISPAECLPYIDAVNRWMASAPNVEMVNGFALPSR